MYSPCMAEKAVGGHTGAHIMLSPKPLTAALEERKRVLEEVFLRYVTAHAEGYDASWDELLQGITYGGAPIHRYSVARWIKTHPEAQEAWDKVVSTHTVFAQDQILRQLHQAIDRQLRVAVSADRDGDSTKAFQTILTMMQLLNMFSQSNRPQLVNKTENVAIILQPFTGEVSAQPIKSVFRHLIEKEAEVTEGEIIESET